MMVEVEEDMLVHHMGEDSLLTYLSEIEDRGREIRREKEGDDMTGQGLQGEGGRERDDRPAK